jgi:uncharacterized protein YlzI (FlbEa/FlbD family)
MIVRRPGRKPIVREKIEQLLNKVCLDGVDRRSDKIFDFY